MYNYNVKKFYTLLVVLAIISLPVFANAQGGTPINTQNPSNPINTQNPSSPINNQNPSTPINTQGCRPEDGKICNPLGDPNMKIQTLLLKILEGVIKIGLPIIVLAIIYSGFLFVTARGNSEKLGKAKDALLYSVIGAAILLGAVALAKLIESTVRALGS